MIRFQFTKKVLSLLPMSGTEIIGENSLCTKGVVNASKKEEGKKEKETVQMKVEDKENFLPNTSDAVHEMQESVLAKGPNMKKTVIKMNERRKERRKIVPERCTEKVLTNLENSVPKQTQAVSSSAIEKTDQGQDEVVIGKLNLAQVMIPVEKKSEGEKRYVAGKYLIPQRWRTRM